MLEKIGEGGMGVVYKALDFKLDRIVAIKFPSPDIAENPRQRARFLHEAKVASILDHPAICNIHEIGETDDGRVFIVMPYYEGITLCERTKLAPLKPEEALDVAIQIADGLMAAHQKGIVHCDITTKNILVLQARSDSSGCVKIIDFGLAANGGFDELETIGSTGGTIPYMSPEQVRGECLDPRTDIWSLGVILYEMLTGRLPFNYEHREAILYAILNLSQPEVHSLVREIPVEISQIIERCLQKEPGDRYQQVGSLLTDLRRGRKNLSRVPEMSSDRMSYLWHSSLTFAVMFVVSLGFVGCSEYSSPTDPLENSLETTGAGTIMTKPSSPTFGMMHGLSPSEISLYGPRPLGKGWRRLFVGADSTFDEIYSSAKSAGYYPIVAGLNRQFIINRDWGSVDREIAYAKQHGADWLYLDDALSHGDGITKGQIDTVAMKVHSGAWRFFAVAEYYQPSMEANPTWHENIDIMMPYNYTFSPAQLDAFFSWVKARHPNKALVPFLGYNVSVGGSVYTQIGEHINVAQKYSSLIFYWAEGGPESFDHLTAYLQAQWGM